jgi:predicted ATP-dependent endonuclease of OLD family
MEDIFITKIKIKKVRHIKDFEINLSESERKHLIITGKNGSGKTSLLWKLEDYLLGYFNYAPYSASNEKMTIDVTFTEYSLARYSVAKGYVIFANFTARREIRKMLQIHNNPYAKRAILEENKKHLPANLFFIEFIEILYFQKHAAKENGDIITESKIETWFSKFEDMLRIIFDDETLTFSFDKKYAQFDILQSDGRITDFYSLPDGYSAILDIVSELIMQIEKQTQQENRDNFDVQGVVLIDELETHLHVDLQKKILPFLTTFFPKIQFIVTTHSPFVINSVSNAVICDLEKRIVTEDLSGYSYDTLIESYFDSDKYSDVLKRKVERYEELLEQNGEGNKDELYEIKKYLNEIPKFVSDELAVKLQQLKLKDIAKKHK